MSGDTFEEILQFSNQVKQRNLELFRKYLNFFAKKHFHLCRTLYKQLPTGKNLLQLFIRGNGQQITQSLTGMTNENHCSFQML